MNNPDLPYNELPLLPPPEVALNVEVYKQLARSSRALAELKGAGGIIPNQSILINMIGLQEAKLSSEIENIVTTNDSLYRAFAGETNPDPATKEVLRYGQALWFAFDYVKKGRPLCTSLFEEIATKIKRIDISVRKIPGTRIQNGLKQNIYSPPEGENVIRDLLYNLENYINDDTKYDADPLIKMAVAHYQFEAIHPFPDGNGRTGRIINIIYLVDKGLLDVPVLYLSKYIIENKTDYYLGLKKVTEEGQWTEWIVYMLKAIEETAGRTKDKVYKIKGFMDDTVEKFRSESPSTYSKDLIEAIFLQPITKIKTIEEIYEGQPPYCRKISSIIGQCWHINGYENWKR